MAIDLYTQSIGAASAYNGHYPDRPVWGYVALPVDTSPTTTNNFFTTFSAKNISVPMTCDYGPGSSQGNVGAPRAVAGYGETGVSQYPRASSTTQTTSESLGPTSSYFGCPYAWQTACGAYVDSNDNGYWSYGHSTGAWITKRHGGIVVGESRFNQTYDLLAYNGKIFKFPVQNVKQQSMITSSGQTRDFFHVSSQMYAAIYGSPAVTSDAYGIGVSSLTTSTNTSGDTNYRYRNYGMVCHNRNTNKLAYVENTGQATYRVHILDLQNKIGKTTTVTQLKTWFDAAIAAGSSRYNYYDITLPSWNNSYSEESHQQIKWVLCDDNTMWAIGQDISEGSTAYLRLYRCIDTTSYATWTLLSTLTTTTNYSTAQGPQYGITHMNSDDNSRIAVWIPYYYYHSGMECFIVDTRTAYPSGDNVRWESYEYQSSSGFAPFVPCGGPNFFTGNISSNSDGPGVYGQFMNYKILRGIKRSHSAYTTYALTTLNQSTAYQAWYPFKIQPTKEWKPEDEPFNANPIALTYRATVTASGTSAYVFTGTMEDSSYISTNNQAIAITQGDSLVLSVSAAGQPLWIKTAATTGTGNTVSTGVTNNGTASGTVTWDTTSVTPGLYYYNSENSASMTGTIKVLPKRY